MPAIPNVPGVPNLTSYLPSPIALLVQDAVGLLFGTTGEWGIFLDGAPAFEFESLVALGFKKDWVIADYPVEDGSFLSYDKVEMPYEIHLRITSGGTEEERQALLDAVAEEAGSTNLYTIVSPEQVFENANVARFNFRRTSSEGLGMIVMDITFQEIRLSDPAAFSNTQQPGVAGQLGGGNVQAVAASTSIQSRVAAAGVM